MEAGDIALGVWVLILILLSIVSMRDGRISGNGVIDNTDDTEDIRDFMPCPRCGTLAESGRIRFELFPYFDERTGERFYSVKCHTCGAQTGYFPTKEEAEAYWNDVSIEGKWWRLS